MAMKLSEAIRKGAALRPQAFRGFFRENSGSILDRTFGSCALGAACEGMMLEEEGRRFERKPSQSEVLGRLALNWPKLFKNPEPGEGEELELGPAGWEVIEMNDIHKRSREEIAAYLEGHGL